MVLFQYKHNLKLLSLSLKLFLKPRLMNTMLLKHHVGNQIKAL